MAPKKKVKRSKTQKNKPWTDKQTNIFAAVLSSTESRDKPFALVLETMALKKTANESVFNNVREGFEDMLVAEGITAASEDYSFTIEQLRQKYKWLKKQWKAINVSIRSGSGLGAKDTETPTWYDLLDPIFTESVDSFTEISSKAEDLNSVDSDNLDSDEERSVALSSVSEKQSERANKAMHQEDASFEEGEGESLKPKIMKPLPKSDKKETKVKVCKRNKQPKSQSAAVMEMVKTMKEAADVQEKNNEQRLTTLLEAERKRDEMFLTFQREQAEANRKHEMLMAQMLMQMNRNPSPPNMYIPPSSTTSSSYFGCTGQGAMQHSQDDSIPYYQNL